MRGTIPMPRSNFRCIRPLQDSSTRSLTFAAVPSQVAAARAWAVSVSGLTGDRADVLGLLVSEVATNALRHSRSGEADGAYTVTAEPRLSRVRVRVLDSGQPDGRLRETPRMRESGPDEETGRGLWLVDMLSRAWGSEIRLDGRTLVWFDVAAEVRRAPEAA